MKPKYLQIKENRIYDYYLRKLGDSLFLGHFFKQSNNTFK